MAANEQTKPKVEHKYVKRYATIVIGYNEDETKESTLSSYTNATQLLYQISNCLLKHNQNCSGTGSSRFNIEGFYIDEADMSINEQNQKLEEITANQKHSKCADGI